MMLFIAVRLETFAEFQPTIQQQVVANQVMAGAVVQVYIQPWSQRQRLFRNVLGFTTSKQGEFRQLTVRHAAKPPKSGRVPRS